MGKKRQRVQQVHYISVRVPNMEYFLECFTLWTSLEIKKSNFSYDKIYYHGQIMSNSEEYKFMCDYSNNMPVTVAERSKVCTLFARSEAGIVVSNPTQDMDV
jgi:hypothetical protein